MRSDAHGLKNSQGGDMQTFLRRLFVIGAVCLLPLVSFGEAQKKYILTIEPSTYQEFRETSQRSGSILSLRSAQTNYLDQVQMVVATLTLEHL